jgi:hypothetical protein
VPTSSRILSISQKQRADDVVAAFYDDFPATDFPILVLSSIHVHAAVNSTTIAVEGGHGNIRFHYDDSIDIENSCKTVILVGVGTAKAVGNYDKLSYEVATDSSIVCSSSWIPTLGIRSS